MLLAVLSNSPSDTETLCHRIRRSSAGRRGAIEACPFTDREAFFSAFQPGRFGGAVIGLGDSAGFLAARRVWELDQACRILVIDDTQRYALQCLRIHAVDFLLRPVTDERFERGLKQLLR